MANTSLNVKKRNWALVCYPDSLPSDWLEILEQTGLPIAISPLHDKDNNADETEKKPHYHVILCYSGPTAFTVVKRIADKLNAPIPQALESIKGYYRYLTHKDNPEKAQYNESEIRCLNGFNIADFIELTKSEVTEIKKQIIDLINSNDFTEYCDLIDFLMDGDSPERLDIAMNHTIFFNAILRSRRYKKDRGITKCQE